MSGSPLGSAAASCSASATCPSDWGCPRERCDPCCGTFSIKQTPGQRLAAHACLADPSVPTSLAAPRLPSVLLVHTQVYVWLPPGYNEARAAGQRFPVIYCQDGQNKVSRGRQQRAMEEGTRWRERVRAPRGESARVPQMDARTSWLNADWNLGRAATLLLEEGKIRAPIFVLIYNSGTLRRIEYGDNPVGRAYVDWMCDDLKPRIDREFASLPAPRHTMALGSSMGGSPFVPCPWPYARACACMCASGRKVHAQARILTGGTGERYRIHLVPGDALAPRQLCGRLRAFAHVRTPDHSLRPGAQPDLRARSLPGSSCVYR